MEKYDRIERVEILHFSLFPNVSFTFFVLFLVEILHVDKYNIIHIQDFSVFF